jgi:hypothetical protein
METTERPGATGDGDEFVSSPQAEQPVAFLFRHDRTDSGSASAQSWRRTGRVSSHSSSVVSSSTWVSGIGVRWVER